MNLVVLTGRTTNDIEIKYSQSGTAIAGFSLAVDDGYGDNKKTHFIPCKAFGKTAETAGNYVVKGQKLTIQGKLSINKFETAEGQKRTFTEVIVDRFEFGEKKKGEPVPGQEGQTSDPNQFGKDVFNEEIPF